MNVLGEDIKQVINEVGEPIAIYKHNTQKTVREKLDFKRFWGTRIPFENEYQVLCSLVYDTKANPGDRMTILSDNTHYVIANMVSEYFEGFIITKESFMYKCNSTFSTFRLSSGLSRDENYSLQNEWDIVLSGEYCLFTGALEYGHSVEDEMYARFQQKKRRLITSNDLNIQIGDKIEVIPAVSEGIDSETEIWMVELLEANRLHGIKVCNLGEFTG